MADPQPRSETLYLLGGIAVIGLVAWLSTRQGGNTLQLTQPPTQPTPETGAPFATHSMAFDTTALSDPLTSLPPSAFGGSMQAPGQYVELASGTTVPFMPGIAYDIGSIIHYGDGTVQIL